MEKASHAMQTAGSGSIPSMFVIKEPSNDNWPAAR